MANLVNNPGVETPPSSADWLLQIVDPNNLGYSASSFTQSTDAHSGLYSGHFVVPVAIPRDSGYVIVVNMVHGWAVGQTYRFGIWYKLTGGQIFLNVNCNDIDWALLLQNSVNLAPTGGTWQYAEVTVGPVPANTDVLNIVFDNDGLIDLLFDDAVMDLATSITQYPLNISVSGQGTTNPAAGGNYDSGSQVQVTANPALGNVFDHWILNGASSSQNPITVTMSAAMNLTAVFVQASVIQHLLTINTTPPGVAFTVRKM